MSGRRFRVGIIGLQPGRSWAAVAHVPALAALPDDFEIVGVANSSLASAEAAARACGIPRAFAGPAELAASPEVDIVTVTVKVPHHDALVRAALQAGKHVYCEWPLGNGLAEAEALAALAREKRVHAVVGMQAVAAPELEHVGQLVAGGYVGEVLSTSLIASGYGWGDVASDESRYVLDAANGATMLTIPVGHALAAIEGILGGISEVSAVVATRRPVVRLAPSGVQAPMTAPDQVLASGLLEGGAPISIHYVGGMPRGMGLLWRITGTEGDLEVVGDMGQMQMTPLAIRGGRGADRTLAPIAAPAERLAGFPEATIPRNVARLYARMAADLRDGTHTAPTFDDAVRVHRMVAAIAEAGETGARIRL
jgi:predicted dehydrogenase